MLGRLNGDTGWVVAVLEEQELPVKSRIESSEEKGVYYIEWGSVLHSSVMGMVGGRPGCWILQKKGSDLEKYSCGLGYEAP